MSNQFTWSVPFSADELRTDYLDDGMSQVEVAAKWGVTQRVVWKALRKFGIKARRARSRSARDYSWEIFDLSYIPEPNSGCWLWTEYVNKCGYGRTRMDGKPHSAHRLALSRTGADIAGKCVLHRCDTPSCVNPEHLSAGTQQENIADMVRKKRLAPVVGERNPKSKLTEADVRLILGCVTGAVELARRYSVTKELIYQIRNRRCWAHIKVDHDRT